jgi:hypothetical protein
MKALSYDFEGVSKKRDTPNQNFLEPTHMKNLHRAFPLTALSLASVALLSACGGGGSSTAAAPVALAGAVIDGYVTGAIVCLDLKSNGTCDSGEPTTTSGAGGRYSLNAPAGTNLANLHIIATVPAGAIDSDAPGVPVANPYKMLAPAGMPTVVSPLTTVVSTRMITGSLSLANARMITTSLRITLPPTTPVHATLQESWQQYLRSRLEPAHPMQPNLGKR